MMKTRLIHLNSLYKSRSGKLKLFIVSEDDKELNHRKELVVSMRHEVVRIKIMFLYLLIHLN